MPVKKKGDMVEGFRVMSEIGRGAASVIYLVQNPKDNRIWALKQVEKQTEKDQRFLDQTIEEAKVAQAVSHPGLRKVEKVIKKGSFLAVKELFLVMEFVDGISLEKHPPATFEEAVDVFEQTAEALAAMHAAGYVHADMKPNNIVITEEGKVKVIDLGQSCAIGTIKPRIQGTPDYIAPEQVHRRPITPRTDIYNFGATMYWVLTRQHVPTALAKGDSLVGSLDDNLIAKPTPAIELNPRVPIKLNDLIMECVEVEEEKRPASMNEVIDRLNLILGILRAKSESTKAGLPAIADEKD
ncbi:Purine nucleoside phosphorylase [hydrothermal vent metagenome]|uniref:Purine nucleoside phosphorylase n=1 Tax=hydrothermal vent metagenome TaxID=652676 RepID=A0A3B1DET1_9ZZZZ